MVSTKRTVETEEDRYGGFRTQQNDLFSSTTYESPYVSRSFSFGSTDSETEEKTEDFEVEKEYSFDGYQDPSQENEERPVRSYMPTIEQDRPQSRIVEEVEYTQTKTKLRLNARGKILVCAYSLVVAILVAFSIYNAISISNLNSAIAGQTIEYVTVQNQVASLEQTYQALGSQVAIEESLSGSGFSRATEQDFVSVSLGDKHEVISIEESSNAFDKICKFLSELF